MSVNLNRTGKDPVRRTALTFSILFLIAATAPVAAQVSIVKATNGQDANSPPGPVVAVGSAVNWTYVVTSGGRDVTNIAVTDDQGVTVTCPFTSLLAGSSMTCTASGIAVPGQYANIGTVNALEAGVPVSASDPSHYFGQPAGLITLVKATNGQDANLPPGPVLAVGAAVNWTYVVTNTGTQSITNVAVTDDQGVAVICPQNTLAVNASMTCTGSGTAQAGQYTNIGTVTATHPVFGTIVATDPSHYFGQSANFDFGDAPDSYGTAFASNGARHVLGTNVYLGACVDAELDGQPSAGANGDDTNVGTSAFGICAVAGADEDGVTFNSALAVGQTASITVVTNAACTLSAWIDFNANGNFSDASDNLFPGGTNLVAGSNLLTFTVPSTAVPGATYARFRCTTDGVVGPVGPARDGEVEDYKVTIVAPVTTFTGPSATGTGNITASFTGGGAGCSYSLSQFIPLTGHPASPPAGSAPTGVSFPHGLFKFTTTGCTVGGVVTFAITYPTALPAGTEYWKYGPTPGNTTKHWYTIPATVSANQITFSITDGGLGDDGANVAPDGIILDQGGPGFPVSVSIPTLSEWGLIILSALLGVSGFVNARRRKRVPRAFNMKQVRLPRLL